MEEHRRNRETAVRLAEEMAVIAEIGRLIGSTLDIVEVYERFAAEARKLILFDRLSVNLNSPHDDTLTVAYAYGSEVPGRVPGNSFPLTGTISEVLMRTRTGLIFHPATVEEIASRFPSLVPGFEAGLRSQMSVPLISRDRVIGALHFLAKKPEAYAEQDLRLAERIGAQIAGAVANAQLFADLKKTEKSLRVSEERSRAIADYTVDWQMWIDPGGRLLWVNPSVEEMTGYSVEECLNNPDYPLFIIHPDDKIIISTYLEFALQAGNGKDVEFRFVRKDGTVRWGTVSWQPIFDAQGRPMGHRSSIHDITEHKRLLEEIEQRTKQLMALHETSVELSGELNLSALLQSIAHRALNLVGGKSCNWYLYRPEMDLMERVASAGLQLIPSGTTRKRGEGVVGHVWATGAPLLINDYHSWPGRKREYDPYPSRAMVAVPVHWGEEFLGVLNIMAYVPHRYTQEDVETLSMFAGQAAIAIRNAQLYSKIEQSAVTDELKGLFNRRGFFQLGERELERASRFSRPLAALMFDIDHFKMVNDTHGHAGGDQVLRALAACFLHSTRGIDVAGRYGGEEFVLLLPETLLPGALQIAERLRQSIAELVIPVSPANAESQAVNVCITVSIGVAALATDIPSLTVLLDRADQALYRAKNSGRNRVALWEDGGNFEPSIIFLIASIFSGTFIREVS